MPLRAFLFFQAFPGTQLGSRLMVLTRLLFPTKAIIPPAHNHLPVPIDTFQVARKEVLLLFAAFVMLFAFYALAVRILPKYITARYIFLSTLALGLVYAFLPIATSQDIFSYAGYARLGVVYHLNPLTALPSAMPKDPIYPYIFWINQPSAYGPVWAVITEFLQWITLTLGLKSIIGMVLPLRLLGLLAHLGSTWLIWSISGRLQAYNEAISWRRRLFATLAFGWNPLLLFEACSNAHNDVVVLFLILLALWALLPAKRGGSYNYLLAVALLALAACIKITFLLLFPGLLLYLWAQHPRRWQSTILATLAYMGLFFILYAPFWQGGAVLYVLHINPGVTRDINSLYDSLVHFYFSLRGKQFLVVSSDVGSRTEIVTHQISMVFFVIVYGALCIGALFARWQLRSLPALIRWMALIWLLYCLVGSPWFWSWYLEAFFGLAALMIAISTEEQPMLGVIRLPLAFQLLTFSMLGLYCFATWAARSYIPLPRLAYFQWAYLRGLWAWLFLVPAIQLELLTKRFFSRKEASSINDRWLSKLVSGKEPSTVASATRESVSSKGR
ncbi:MAG TPA: hypothetical protein VFU49_07525 [Ktedonobacteraceae bacterium]|nr:hypothetical protein [Ktedonobacteraceae bacterium]